MDFGLACSLNKLPLWEKRSWKFWRKKMMFHLAVLVYWKRKAGIPEKEPTHWQGLVHKVLEYWSLHRHDSTRQQKRKNKQTTKFNDEKHYPVIKKMGAFPKFLIPPLPILIPTLSNNDRPFWPSGCHPHVAEVQELFPAGTSAGHHGKDSPPTVWWHNFGVFKMTISPKKLRFLLVKGLERQESPILCRNDM